MASLKLWVRDLARSLEFYVRKVGFVLRTESPGRATLAEKRLTDPDGIALRLQPMH